MKLTPTQAQRAFVPLIALAMSAFMSFVMTAFNFGVAGGFVAHWLQNWALGFTVALPTALLVVPMIRNGLARVTAASSAAPPSPRQDDSGTRAPIGHVGEARS